MRKLLRAIDQTIENVFNRPEWMAVKALSSIKFMAALAVMSALGSYGVFWAVASHIARLALGHGDTMSQVATLIGLAPAGIITFALMMLSAAKAYVLLLYRYKRV